MLRADSLRGPQRAGVGQSLRAAFVTCFMGRAFLPLTAVQGSDRLRAVICRDRLARRLRAQPRKPGGWLSESDVVGAYAAFFRAICSEGWQT